MRRYKYKKRVITHTVLVRLTLEPVTAVNRILALAHITAVNPTAVNPIALNRTLATAAIHHLLALTVQDMDIIIRLQEQCRHK